MLKTNGQNVPKRDQISTAKEIMISVILGQLFIKKIVEDIAHKIRAGWMNQRRASGVSCDHRFFVPLLFPL